MLGQASAWNRIWRSISQELEKVGLDLAASNYESKAATKLILIAIAETIPSGN